MTKENLLNDQQRDWLIEYFTYNLEENEFTSKFTRKMMQSIVKALEDAK